MPPERASLVPFPVFSLTRVAAGIRNRRPRGSCKVARGVPRCWRAPSKRKTHIVPLWPDVRQKRAESLGMDTRPAMPGTVPRLQMPGQGEGSTANAE